MYALYAALYLKWYCFSFQPVLIGEAGYSLSCVLQKKQLRQTVVLPVQNMKGDSVFPEVGPLQVRNRITLVIIYDQAVL